MPIKSPSQRVAVIHDWLVSSRGGERVLEAILELYPEAEIFTLFYDPEKVSEKIRRHTVHASFLNRIPLARRFYRFWLPWFPLAIESFDLSGFDLVISSSHCVAKGVIVSPSAKHVCYSHTPMRYAWDRYGDYFGRGWKQIPFAPFLHYLRIWDVTSSARVDRFLANSAWTGKRIQKYYRRDAEVVHPFVDLEAFPLSQAPRKDHYLVVSAFAPYKRIDLAIRACRRLGLSLSIVGEGQDEAHLKRLGGNSVTFLGRLGPGELKTAYAEARALLFPGEEDFGITPLEAMACGTPVIAFSRGGVAETVVEGKTGRFFAEQTVESMTAAIEAFDKESYSPAACRARAEQFSRAQFQEKLRAALATVAN